MSMTTCLVAFYVASVAVVSNTLDVAIRSGVAAAVTAAAGQRRPQLVEFITPAALAVIVLFWSVVIMFYRLAENHPRPWPIAEAAAANKQQSTTVVAKRSKTKQTKDDNLDAEDSTTSSPPSKISKKSASNAATAGGTAAVVATAAGVSVNSKSKPSPPPSPQKVRKAAVTAAVTASASVAAEQPAAQPLDRCEVDQLRNNNNNNNNKNNNDDEDDCGGNNDDDDENTGNNNDCGGVRDRPHQAPLPHKRGRRSSVKTVVKTEAKSVPSPSPPPPQQQQQQPQPQPNGCKTSPAPPAPVVVLPVAAEAKQPSSKATRAEAKPPATPLIDVDSPPTSDSTDNKIAIKVFSEKKKTPTGKRATTDLLQPQKELQTDGGRIKKECHPQEAATKRPQNKENVKPQPAEDYMKDEDSEKIAVGNNGEDFELKLETSNKRVPRAKRKRNKKNKNQAPGVNPIAAAGAEQEAPVQDKPAENAKSAVDNVAAKPAADAPPPPPYAGSKQRADLNHLTDERIWNLLKSYYLVPQSHMYGCGMPISCPGLPGYAVFFRMNTKPKKLNPVAKEFSLDEQWTASPAEPDTSTHEPLSPSSSSSLSSSSTPLPSPPLSSTPPPSPRPQHHRELQRQWHQQQRLQAQQLLHHDESAWHLDQRLLVEEHVCVRCKSFFTVKNERLLASEGRCMYHHGKMYKRAVDGPKYYDCCNTPERSPGCTKAECHVWNGFVDGHNGPMPGFVNTSNDDAWPPPPTSSCSSEATTALEDSTASGRVYGMDCEMCYTECGLEATKVTLVNLNGDVVYDSMIRPSRPIVDYNTRFSGITVENFKAAKSLAVVRRDLLRYIRHDTILVGHGLGSDLLALRMIHPLVVDTTVLYPPDFTKSLPVSRALKYLAQMFLKRNIQRANGHDSVEDARAAVDLTLAYVHRMFKGSYNELRFTFHQILDILWDCQRKQMQEYGEPPYLQLQYLQLEQVQEQRRQNGRARRGRRRGCNGEEDDDNSSTSSTSSTSGCSSSSSGSNNNTVGRRS